MTPDRRALLRTVGLGAGAALAGCLGLGDSGTETPTSGGVGIADVETLPFTVRNDPDWYDDSVGYAAVADSEDRRRALIGIFDPSGDRHDDISDFLDGIDYETERLVVVESAGPNACYSRLDVGSVRVEEGRLRADATVADTSEDDEACADVVTFPSTLLRVAFEDAPADEVAIDVTDGWGEQATVTATADDALSPDPADLPGHVRPDAEPSPVAPLDCARDGIKRHPQWFDEGDVAWGDLEADGESAFSVRVESVDYEYGDTARIQLTNVADETLSTGTRAKYNLQVYTDEGWQDLRVKDEDGYFEYTDEAVGHPPGDGFAWDIELTEDGIVEGTYHDDAGVCPDLQSGRYRFAYFGAIGDGAVAVSFDLTV
ncbi:hypothetical protein [Natronomonas amylolytica]|uniref:hypothetical protein n=1 Tax=Natronomonas amylolytica TaxID=3108498 RepID=UPI00300AFEFC